jgi:transcriptional regulator
MLEYHTQRRRTVLKKLSNKIIYDDFVSKTRLTDDEIKVLDMLLDKELVIKIAQELHMSDRNISRIKRSIKEKYNNYKTIEIAKADIFRS